MALKLEIVTPEGVAYEAQVDSVVVPTLEGQIGILPGHIPLLGKVRPGAIHTIAGGKHDYIATDKGYVRVLKDVVSILTEAAVDVKGVDLDKIKNAQQRAQAALAEARANPDLAPEDIERYEIASRFALTQELVKKGHHR